MDTIGGCNNQTAPIDDVCPICFDGFSLPCRSNCGHWFCASCIMHFWKFRPSIQPCKCPLCYSPIVSLQPDASLAIRPVDDDAGALDKLSQYNSLYNGRRLGGLHVIRVFPIFMKRVFGVAMDPDVLRCTYYILRLLGLFLAMLYERWEFEFVPTGGLGIQRMFDASATILIAMLFLIGACRCSDIAQGVFPLAIQIFTRTQYSNY